MTKAQRKEIILNVDLSVRKWGAFTVSSDKTINWHNLGGGGGSLAVAVKSINIQSFAFTGSYQKKKSDMYIKIYV